jgi:trehalose synthase
MLHGREHGVAVLRKQQQARDLTHHRRASAPHRMDRHSASWSASLQVPIERLPVEQLQIALGSEARVELDDALQAAAEALTGRALWMVNSTSVGGGVAELLRSWVPYWRAAGIDQHWAVVSAAPAFFHLTKRIHNFLHGHPGDGGELGERERRVYEAALATNAVQLVRALRPGDVVVLHDPQTAGLVQALKKSGAIVVWRSHVGADRPNPLTETAWAFLEPYLAEADAFVFSRRSEVPPPLQRVPVSIIAPCIDPTSTKNRHIDPVNARAILARAGIVETTGDESAQPIYHRHDASTRRLKQHATVRRVGKAPCVGADPIVVHLSRWDRLKDPLGVLESFTHHILDAIEAQLILAGPTARAVVDDPESEETYSEVERRWEALPRQQRARIHLVRLPMTDLDDNAAIVNALQGQADVVIKKSLEEGFGLGVTEAMWKGRAVVASAVGGHRDQIEDGISGVLVDDPSDLARFGDAVANLLSNPERARRLGNAARRRVRDRYLLDHHAASWAALLSALTQ